MVKFRCLMALAFAPLLGFASAPDKYLEYVQSTKDLYVDINYTPKSNTVVEARVAIDNVGQNNTIFCSRKTDNTTFTLFYIADSKNGNYFRWDYTNASRKTGATNIAAGDLIDIRVSGDGLYLWGQLAESTTTASFTPAKGMILFGSHKTDDSIAATGNNARMKLYFFKAYDYDENDNLVLSVDLVPAEVNGVAGLYDRKRDAFYSGLANNSTTTAAALTAGPEITSAPTTVSLRTDVLDHGYTFTPGGVTSPNDGYGFTNLFDGVSYTTSTVSYATNSRWIGNDTSEQYVDVESAYFTVRSGTLVSYTVHKVSMYSYAINARTPISWRLEGVLESSADDDAWTTIDTQTDVVWPGVSTYVYDASEDPPGKENCSLSFPVSGAKQAPYRRLRFVPLDSMMKRHNASEANLYSLMEVDFRVRDAAAGMNPDAVMISATPDAYGTPIPGYGETNNVAAGSSFTCSIPEMSYANAEETLRAVCMGWKIYTYNSATRLWDYDENNPSSHGSGNSFTYTHGSVAAKVEWQFKMQAYVNATALGDGTTTGTGWYDLGSEVTISATANGTNVFRRWEDLPEGVDGSAAELTFTVTGPVAPKASIGGFRYVAKTGSDENDGRTQATAFLTINHALADLGPAGGTVYVGAGAYTETNGVDLAAINITNEVALVGATGRAEDVRVTYKEAGSTRHVILINNPNASARYITFYGGRATTVSWGNSDTGMNVRIGGNGGTIEDCIVSGASGSGWNQHGLGLYLSGGRASRCIIMGNSITSENGQGGAGLGVSAGIVEDCLIVSNNCQGAGAVYLTGTATMLNCTVAANTGVKYAGVNVEGESVRVVNCAILGNVANNTSAGKVYKGTTTGFVNCVADLEIPNSTGCIVAQPAFRDMPNGDFRPSAASACIDAGAARSDYGAVSAADLDGSTRVVGEAVDIGCYENQKNELECGFTWSVSSAIEPGEVELEASVFGASGNETYAWTVHNETTGADVPVDSLGTVSLTGLASGLYTVSLTVTEWPYSASHVEAGAFRIGPRDVYVDSASASVQFPYSTRKTAALSIAEGLEAAVDGSIVHVADGTYGITAQILVDKGVCLIGESGKKSGVVVRRTANNVRNIQVNHPDAWVANMTFENGLIAGHGGCLYINGRGGTVSNCVFSGGRTTAHNDYSAGGVLMDAGLLTHCEITDCTSVHKDGGSQCRVLKMKGGRASNCLIHGNALDYSGAIVSLENSARIENCTIVSNTVVGTSTAITCSSGTTVRNCAIFAKNEEGVYAACSGTDAWSNFWPRRYENCATFEPIAEYTTSNGGKGWYYGYNNVTNVTESDCFVNAATGDYRPLRDGALWNAGTNVVGVLPSVDFAGRKRMYKDIIDIGCFEGSNQGSALIVR